MMAGTKSRGKGKNSRLNNFNEAQD